MIGLFVASGLAAALVGLIRTSQLGTGLPTAAIGTEITVLTSVLLGGGRLAGGRGSVVGTVLALLVISVIDNGLSLTNVTAYAGQVFHALLLIIALVIDRPLRPATRIARPRAAKRRPARETTRATTRATVRARCRLPSCRGRCRPRNPTEPSDRARPQTAICNACIMREKGQPTSGPGRALLATATHGGISRAGRPSISHAPHGAGFPAMVTPSSAQPTTMQDSRNTWLLGSAIASSGGGAVLNGSGGGVRCSRAAPSHTDARVWAIRHQRSRGS